MISATPWHYWFAALFPYPFLRPFHHGIKQYQLWQESSYIHNENIFMNSTSDNSSVTLLFKATGGQE